MSLLQRQQALLSNFKLANKSSCSASCTSRRDNSSRLTASSSSSGDSRRTTSDFIRVSINEDHGKRPFYRLTLQGEHQSVQLRQLGRLATGIFFNAVQSADASDGFGGNGRGVDRNGCRETCAGSGPSTQLHRCRRCRRDDEILRRHRPVERP